MTEEMQKIYTNILDAFRINRKEHSIALAIVFVGLSILEATRLKVLGR
jgi:hypothetical protein